MNIPALTMDKIQIIDYGQCNKGSVISAFKRLGTLFEVSHHPKEINEQIDKIILPGVSSFDTCVHALKKTGFWDYLKNPEKLENKKILGICAGAQILFEGSEEGNEEGLGLLEGLVKKIKPGGNIKIPHLGWNRMEANPSHPKPNLLTHVNLEKRFYFSHSYHFPKSDHSLAFVDYGCQFPVIISNESVTAIQFHPEKSYSQGLQLLKNFCTI